jgi:hypothetical protein
VTVVAAPLSLSVAAPLSLSVDGRLWLVPFSRSFSSLRSSLSLSFVLSLSLVTARICFRHRSAALLPFYYHSTSVYCKEMALMTFVREKNTLTSVI